MDEIRVEQPLTELLPNQEFVIDESAPQPLAAGFVSATIEAVRPGSGYSVAGDDAPVGTVVPYDDPEALWRVADLELRVAQSFGDEFTPGQTIRVGLAFDGAVNSQTIANGLLGRDVVVVLDQPGLFTHDRSLYSIGESGTLLGFVDADQISMPLLGELEDSFMGRNDTVSELSKASERDVPVIDVVMEAQVPVREE